MLKKIKGNKLTIILGIVTLIIMFFQVYSANLNVELSNRQYSNLLHEMEILDRGDLVNNRMIEITKEIEILTLRMVADEYLDLEINRTQFRDESYKPTLEKSLNEIENIKATLDERDNLSKNLYANLNSTIEFRNRVSKIDIFTSTITMGFILVLFVYTVIDHLNTKHLITITRKVNAKNEKVIASKKNATRKKKKQKKK